MNLPVLPLCAAHRRRARDAGAPTGSREALGPARTVHARAAPGCSPRHRSGHHGEAPRRPRAHLAVDAHAGEGARRGATPPVALLSLGRVEKKEASGRESE
jgi:hypothetical protein